MSRETIRVATYNIRKAIGTDRRRDPDRILRVIKGLGADILALQEADKRLPPRRPIFKAADILSSTGLVPVSFDHAADSLGWHGNVLLVRPDMKILHRAHMDLPGLEPRGYVEATLEVGSAQLHVVGVHLGLLRASRRSQLSRLIETMAQGPHPAVVMGDFNERSVSVGLGRLAGKFEILRSPATFHSRHPILRLDRIAITRGLSVDKVEVSKTDTTRKASDHLPLFADLRLSAF